MTVRRVVTGHDGERRSVVIEDSAVTPITTELAPGLEAHEMWKVDDTVTVPAPAPTATDGPAVLSYYPPVNGVRFQVLTVPPDGAVIPEGVDVDAELARLERAAPGMLAPQEPDNPGMHTTDTVDYVYVATGTVWLELGDGDEVELHAGDTVVQQGTRHAWRNRGTEPAVIVGTVVGARRAS